MPTRPIAEASDRDGLPTEVGINAEFMNLMHEHADVVAEDLQGPAALSATAPGTDETDKARGNRPFSESRKTQQMRAVGDVVTPAVTRAAGA